MANPKRQNVTQREQNKKGNKILSKGRLISCYVATALIVVLCLVASRDPDVIAQENQVFYYAQAVVAVVFAVYITVRNNKAKKAAKPTGRRLK